MLVIVSSLIALSGATLFWARSRPSFSDEERAEAARELEVVRTRLTDVQCHRPGIPGAGGDAQVTLAALLDSEGAYRACLSVGAGQNATDALRGIVEIEGERRRWGYDVPPLEDPLPPGRGLAFTNPQHPPFPEGSEPGVARRARAACGELAVALSTLAGGDGECSPYPPGSPGWIDIHPEVTQLARATSILAHVLARDGNLGGALTLLVHGVAVVQDFRRGPTSLVAAMLSISAEMTLWSTFNSLLIPEPGPEASLRAKMVELIDALIEEWPHPHDVLLAEAFAGLSFARRSPMPDEEGAVIVVLAAEHTRQVEQWCPHDRDKADCFQATSPTGPFETGLFQQAWLSVGGPNAQRRWEVQVENEMAEPAYRNYYTRLLSSPVAMRIIKVALALSGARQEGVCPTSADIDPRLLDIPFALSPIEITHLDGPQYEVTAPPLVVDPSFERVVFYSICPPVGGRWSDAVD